MSRRKSFGLAIFIAIGVFGEETRSAYADCNGFCATEWSGGSVINLGGLPGFESSEATSINGAGQVVGDSGLSGLRLHATEWSGGSIINLGPGVATSINDAGQSRDTVSSAESTCHGLERRRHYHPGKTARRRR